LGFVGAPWRLPKINLDEGGLTKSVQTSEHSHSLKPAFAAKAASMLRLTIL